MPTLHCPQASRPLKSTKYIDLPYTTDTQFRQVHQPTLYHSARGRRSADSTKYADLPYTILPPADSGRTARRTKFDLAGDVPRAAPGIQGAGAGKIEAKDGLPSADRNNKATLLLTGPFRTAKSSAKDLTPLVLKLQYAKYRDALPAPRRNRLLRR